MTVIATTTSTFGCGSVAKRIKDISNEGITVIGNALGRKLKPTELVALLEHSGVTGVIAGTEIWGTGQFGAIRDLKALVRCGAGTENVDLVAAKACGVITDATFDAPAQAVAELALALILSSLRHIPAHHSTVASGEWKRILGGNLSGRTLGIVGCGRVGTRLAQLVNGFGVELIGYDSYRKSADPIKLVSLTELLSRSDVISLHLPSLQSPLIDEAALKVIRPGTLLVNTSRGNLVDEAAIAEAVVANQVRYATDVYSDEPYQGPLAGLPGVIHLPHVGSFTEETRERMEHEALDRLSEHLMVTLGRNPLVVTRRPAPVTMDAVFFDMDGVLLDSVNIKEEGFVSLFPEVGESDQRKIREYHRVHGGMSRYEKIRYYLQMLGRPDDEDVVAMLASEFSERITDRVRLAAEINGAGAALRTSPCPLFVVSGTPEPELRRVVVARGWTKYFSGVFGSPRGKAEILREVVSTYGFEPSRCVYIGDALGDLAAASEAGMQFVGVNVSFSPTGSTRVRADLQGFWSWLSGEPAQQNQ